MFNLELPVIVLHRDGSPQIGLPVASGVHGLGQMVQRHCGGGSKACELLSLLAPCRGCAMFAAMFSVAMRAAGDVQSWGVLLLRVFQDYGADGSLKWHTIPVCYNILLGVLLQKFASVSRDETRDLPNLAQLIFEQSIPSSPDSLCKAHLPFLKGKDMLHILQCGGRGMPPGVQQPQS